MKRIYLNTLSIVVLMTASCFAQQPNVKRDIKVRNQLNENNKAALTEKMSSADLGKLQDSDETISKEMIRSVSTKVKAYIAKGQITEASAFIRSNMVKCKALNDSQLCEAGLNFHSGYLFQQVAKQDSVNKEDYLQKAINQYEKVLDAFPNNKSALNNLIRINAARANNEASVKWVLAYVEQLPSETVRYFLRMGDLFLKDNKLEAACDFYRKAYQKDPRSERACDAMVTLYTKYNFSCSMTGNIREFALDCKAIGLPNYSEELLRKEMSLAVKDQETTKAVKSMILWAHVLAENSWLFPEKVAGLIDQLYPESAVLSSREKGVKKILKELEFIARAENADAMSNLSFWGYPYPNVSLSSDWNGVTPMHVLLKIYYSKGEQATFKNDYRKAEDFWQAALVRAQNFDNAYFTVVASDLAKLYHGRPEMDPGDNKLDALVRDLFNMKGAAYKANDLQMIRNYHITLGAIFYDKKKWEGGYAANAKFQLQRAVSDRFGPIVNPKLRKMLGDVHSNLGESQKAVDAYGQSIQDYLSLDRLKKASELHTKTKANMPLSTSQKEKYEAVGTIISWRKDMASPNNGVLKGATELNTYLNDASKAVSKAEENLPKDFVQVQFFKGLIDLGSQFGVDRAQEQQIIYANALNKVKNTKDLPSEQDYYRVIKVNNSLLQSLEQPNQLESMQMYNKGDLTYNTDVSKTGYEVYLVPSLNKEIMVPKQLFKLNETLQDNYKKTNNRELAKYKLNKGQFELKTKDN